jgi:hypothetical protein
VPASKTESVSGPRGLQARALPGEVGGNADAGELGQVLHLSPRDLERIDVAVLGGEIRGRRRGRRDPGYQRLCGYRDVSDDTDF